MKRYVVALGVLLLLGGTAAIFWPRGERESIGHTVAFSDGTTMTLNDVTYGEEHRYLSTPLRERVISVLPAKLRAKLSSEKGVLNVGKPSMVFWLERRGNGPTTGAPQLVLCDGSGFGTSGGYSKMSMGGPGNWVEGWAFDYFPRRARTFTLRIYEPGKQYPEAKLIGEFTVKNPKPGKYPVWTAPGPPVTAHEGDMAVTLVDLTAGVGRGANKWKPAPNPTVAMTRAGFRVERNGQPTKEWKPVSVEASDATGNLMDGIWGTGRERGMEYAELQPSLWPAEGGWRLKVGFTQRSNFVASELWTLRVPIPDANPTNLVHTNLQGAVLKYAGQARRSSLSGDHQFRFRLTPPRPEYRLTLVKALDDQGREAKEVGSFESPIQWTFALEVDMNATSLDLTVALHRTRYFDFLVRTDVIPTNSPAMGCRPVKCSTWNILPRMAPQREREAVDKSCHRQGFCSI